MKKTKRAIVLLLFLFSFGSLHAAHIIGGEMNYRCLGNGDYEITLKLYRDCQGNGAQFDGPFNGAMSIYLGDSQFEFDRITMPVADITTVDPDINNPCLILPDNVCVEQGIYQFNLSDTNIGGINLPLATESYYIVYQRCCRNNSISNIVAPESTGATFFIEITPEAQAVCNNTPTFNEFPPIVICNDEDLVFDHSATDSDGDLLVYELCSPLKGGGTAGWTTPGYADDYDGTNPNPDAPPPYNDVTFVQPAYSPTDPIGGDPQLAIDPVTGILTGKPDALGQYVVGICVKEYRNGVLLSTVQRDFQFNVAFCEPTVVATVDGDDLITTDPLFEFSNCNGDTVFNFEAPQNQFINEYIWEFDLGGLNPLSLNQPDVNVTFPGFGNYTGLLILNPGTECGDTANITVQIFEPPTANFTSDYDTCVAGPVAYSDLSVPTGFHDITNWDWNFGNGETSAEQNPTIDYTDPGIYNVSLEVTDENGCQNQMIQEVTWLPVPPLIIIDPSEFRGCAPLDIFFNNLSTPIDNSYEITWDFGDGGTDNTIDALYTYQEPGTYDIHVGITSPIGCYTERFFPGFITVDSFPIADFNFAPDRITNFNPDVSFFDNSIRAVKWDWDFNGLAISYDQNPVFSFPDTGKQVVQLVVYSENNCPDTIQKIVDVIPEVTYKLPNAFTPNDDDINDEFFGVGFYRGMRNFKFEVWNRWGELVFETDDPHVGWNGRRYNGAAKMPNGVYVCQVSYTSPRGMPQQVRGYITLVK